MQSPEILNFSEFTWMPHPTIAGIDSKLFQNPAAYAPTDVLLVRVRAGGTIPWHVHEKDSEIAYVLQGDGVLYSTESEQHEQVTEQKVTAGSAMIVPPQTWHSLVSETEMLIFALHTQG